MPGMAANPQIFRYISLPKERFKLHYLEWIVPESMTETIEHYAERMCSFIKEKNVVLVGVSFGGVIVQEMAKIITPKKVVLIASIKSNKELPKRLRFIKNTRAYKLFPATKISDLESFIHSILGKLAHRKLKHIKTYLSFRDPLYLKWALYNVLHWSQDYTTPNILHIHGTADILFPIKHIDNCEIIKGGEHIMIIRSAKEISLILSNRL